MTYKSKLKNPLWQKKRLEILNYAKFRCQICGDKTSELHVHHSYYIKGKQPWQYPKCSMIAVCDVHHKMIHGKREETNVKDEEQYTPAEALAELAEFRKSLADENKDR